MKLHIATSAFAAAGGILSMLLGLGLVSQLPVAKAIYSHYEECTQFLIEGELAASSLCPKGQISRSDGARRPLIETIPNAVDGETLGKIRASIAEAQTLREKHQLSQRFISQVDVDPTLVARLRGAAGYLPVADRDVLPTVTVEGESSVPHVDCYLSETTNKVESLMGPRDRVAFLWVDTEQDGRFRYGDVTLPVEAGTFVHFRADIPHYTVLPSGGSASMLGPFELSSPRPIGSKSPFKCGEGDLDEEFCSTLSPEECCASSDGRCVLCPWEGGTSSGKASKAPKGTKETKSSKSCGLRCVDRCHDNGNQNCAICQGDGDVCPDIRLLESRFDKYPQDVASKEDIATIIAKTGGDPDGSFHKKEGMLSDEQCAALVDYADGHMGPIPDVGASDNRVDVPVSYLVKLIGTETTKNILSFFYESFESEVPIFKVYIRRMVGDDHDRHISYHTDHEYNKDILTLVLVLDNDEDTKGGDLFYLNKNGIMPANRAQGMAIAHGPHVIHAVAPYVGARYSLFFAARPGADCLFADLEL